MISPARLLELTYTCLPRPRLRAASTGGARDSVERIIVFGSLPNPTFDYYFAARLSAPGMPPFESVDISDTAISELNAHGTFVIVCRYASRAVLNWISTHREVLAGVGLFLDDDIPAIVTGGEAPISYRISLAFRALLPLRRLSSEIDIVWASTEALAATIPACHPHILPPAPSGKIFRSELKSTETPIGEHKRLVTIGYHATAIHVDEHTFLMPVIRDVLDACPDVCFEVYAGAKARKKWSQIPRVNVLRPISWEAYQNRLTPLDIMLVPLAPSRVNVCRSPTKRIDAARLGAAAVLSASRAYGLEREGSEPILPYIRDLWTAEIIRLVRDPIAREAAAAATRLKVENMSNLAVDGLQLARN